MRAGVPVLLDCLDDLDAEVVGEAIHILAWFPEEITSIRPGLLAITSDDQQPVQIAEAALVAVGLLGGTRLRGRRSRQKQPIVDPPAVQKPNGVPVCRWRETLDALSPNRPVGLPTSERTYQQ